MTWHTKVGSYNAEEYEGAAFTSHDSYRLSSDVHLLVPPEDDHVEACLSSWAKSCLHSLVYALSPSFTSVSDALVAADVCTDTVRSC